MVPQLGLTSHPQVSTFFFSLFFFKAPKLFFGMRLKTETPNLTQELGQGRARPLGTAGFRRHSLRPGRTMATAPGWQGRSRLRGARKGDTPVGHHGPRARGTPPARTARSHCPCWPGAQVCVLYPPERPSAIERQGKWPCGCHPPLCMHNGTFKSAGVKPGFYKTAAFSGRMCVRAPPRGFCGDSVPAFVEWG